MKDLSILKNLVPRRFALTQSFQAVVIKQFLMMDSVVCFGKPMGSTASLRLNGQLRSKTQSIVQSPWMFMGDCVRSWEKNQEENTIMVLSSIRLKP